MATATFEIGTRNQTLRLGQQLAGLLRPGDVVGLRGDLGAGKTTLAGAVAHGLGVPEEVPVTSPSFTLINEHMGRVPVFHLDLYRLGDPSELYDLGLWEYYDSDGVCLVEWCDRFDDLWPADALVITLHLLKGERRRIECQGVERGAELVAALTEYNRSPTS
jgi:tRNA threonylcarbamoyladenosine biosynthesis protein TsaE